MIINMLLFDLYIIKKKIYFLYIYFKNKYKYITINTYCNLFYFILFLL